MATPSVSLSAPYTLFPLALPLKAKGRDRACYTAPVVESRKRKRSSATRNEIATAVDGEGVNIYDVRSSQTVSSYALQPTTKFSCAPTSSVSRTAKTTSRRTFAALSAPKRQLVCWEETIGPSDTPLKQHSADSGSQHDVIYIQDLSVIARRGKEEEDVSSGLLAVYADGHIRMFSEDLQTQHWDFVLPSQKKKEHGATTVYAISATTATARKAVLSNRSDIVLSEGNNEEMVLVVITQSSAAFTTNYIAVPVIANKKTPRLLLSFQLPTREEDEKPTPSTFSVHFPTGMLYKLSSTHLTTYNLASTHPAILTTVPMPPADDDASPKSLLRISSSTVLVTTNDAIALYDTKFSSLQASISIKQPTTTASSGNNPATGNVFLTTFIQDMDLVLGYAQSGIVGIQLGRSRPDAKGGLLVDSLGRGVAGADDAKVGIPSTSVAKTHESKRVKMQQVIHALRDSKNKGDLTRFECVFLEYVGLRLPKTAVEEEDTAMVDGVDGEKEKSVAVLDDIAVAIPSFKLKPLRAEFVRALLSMIFEVTETSSLEGGEAQMKIAIFPPNVLRYLLESGNFSTMFLPLKQGLMKALLAHDPTLRSIQWFLSSLTDLPITEVLAAIELALSPTTDSPENGEDPVVFEIHRAEIVRMACIRLATFPASRIVKSLKTLPGDTLILFIRLLENELMFLSTPDDDDDDEDAGSSKTIGLEDNLQIIADLLTYSLDAVGVAGLVMQPQETVDGIKECVDEVVDALRQTEALKGVVEELFRHVDWEEISQQPVTNHKRQGATTTPAVVGHKKMLAATRVSKNEVIRQDRPVALSAKAASSVLPLGGVARRRIGGAVEGGKKEGGVKGVVTGKGKRMEYWREGLAAGAYSVETMVV